MKGGAAAVVILILVVVFGAAGAYFYYSSQAQPEEAITVPAQPQQQAVRGAFTADVDVAADAIYVENYGTITSMAVLVDGEEVPVKTDFSGRTGVLVLDEPLTAGEHTVVVRAGGQVVEKRILVDERWTVDFDISGSG